MSKPFTTGSGALVFTVVGSILVSSCSSPPPSQTTTIKVEVPAAIETKEDTNKNSSDTKTANSGASEDAARNKPALDKSAVGNADSEPTARDVEDRVPAAKKSAPKSTNTLLDFYDRLPAKHFASFGGVNRRSLLNRKGAVLDYKHNFIEIPGSDDPKDGDLQALQITLFPNGKEPWCAVSRNVWPYGQTPGALDFYYDSSDSGALRKAADGFFPYKLGKVGGAYENAYLPQKGLDIAIRVDTELQVEYDDPTYHYNRNSSVGEPAFTRIRN